MEYEQQRSEAKSIGSLSNEKFEEFKVFKISSLQSTEYYASQKSLIETQLILGLALNKPDGWFKILSLTLAAQKRLS